MIDLDQAARFLAALDDSGRFTFQTFGDKDKNPAFARILHGSLEDCAAELQTLNEAGAGVFVCVNQTDLKGRKIENVTRIRALFIDSDGPLAVPYPVQPDIIVESGRGPHAYWTVKDCPLEDFTAAQKHLAAFYGTDSSISDLPRVMRLPGFMWQKAEPRLVRLTLGAIGEAVNTAAVVLQCHPVAAPPPNPTPTPIPHTVALEKRLSRAAKYLAKMPAGVAGERGHDATFAAAQAMVRGFDLPPEVALQLLADEFNPRCDPPWSVAELQHKVKSAAADSNLSPGYLLEDDGKTPRVRLGGRDLAADPVVEGLLNGADATVLIPLVAAIASDTTREQLIRRVAAERLLSPKAVASEVKKARAAARQMRMVPSGAGSGAAPLPEIRLIAGELPKSVDAAETALLAAPEGAVVFQRAGSIVRVVRQEAETVWRHGQRIRLERPAGALVIMDLTGSYLVDRFTMVANFQKWSQRAQDWTAADCPRDIAEVYLARSGHWHARPLIGIIEAPMLRPDGSILETPGYDEATGLLYDPGDGTFPPIPESPTRVDAAAALGALGEIIRDFPFVTPGDRAAVLSAILTALIRKSLKSAPLHAFSAPKSRSGKSLLADLVSMLATGRIAVTISQNYQNEDEEKKRLLAVLLAGDPVISYDNIERPFGGAAICMALTQETFTERRLGTNERASAPTAAMFLATGNNLIFTEDITSRVVLCSIDPKLERPEERRFELNLHEYVPAHRGELVVAALTVLRAYHVAGRPDQGLSPWGGFEGWSNWIRSALVWMGEADPTASRRKIEEKDPHREKLRQLLWAWQETFSDRDVTVSDAIRFPNDGLREAMLEVGGVRGEVDGRKVGAFIRNSEDRIEGGLKFVRKSISHHAVTWAVVKSTPPTPLSDSTPLTPLSGENRGVRGVQGVSSLSVREKNTELIFGFLENRHPTDSPDSPNSPKKDQSIAGLPDGDAEPGKAARPETAAERAEPGEFSCEECHGREHRLSRTGKPVCLRCWG